MRRFMNRLNCRPGVTCAAVAESEDRLGMELPPEYVEFLKISDGAEGFIRKEYVILWGVEELPQMNEAYEVQKYVPGLLIFGSNGGGEAYGFDTRSAQWPIVQVPFVGMDWSYARSVGNSFSAFLRRLYEAG